MVDGSSVFSGPGGSGSGSGIGAPPRGATRLLDLEALSFSAGAHTMSNKKVVLPEASYKVAKKGYEEVHVPALKPRAFAAGEREIPIAELPEWARGAFAGMSKLNRVQSKLAPCALGSSENMLLCAPTGAGKTNVAVLAILHELGRVRREDGSFDTGAFKVVYVAPMKALVQEVCMNFTQRFGGAPYSLKVRELSGDSTLSKAEIGETQIIVTTPEKWDVVTRKAGERAYTALVRLLILDEVHLLHDERGAVLEALVARTLRGIESSKEHVRIVGLSATLPNFEDVATFLRVRPESGLFYFDGSFRPCPLQQTFIGVTEKKALKRLALMNDICYTKTLEQAGTSQCIIFVHTRKDTGRTARALRDAYVAGDTLGRLLKEDSASREILQSESENSARDGELKDILPYGFAIHHAGMARSDRTLVEELFADGHVQVLVSTATLAWGVNLPAHTVIIKGTQVYSPEKGRWAELSPLDVQQMLGRAGRPQYDTFGEGIIITGHSELQYYLSLLNQQLPIESQLVARLADTLNAEIVAGSVNSLQEAAVWLGYTYLYVRMLRSPGLYGAAAAAAAGEEAAGSAAGARAPPGDPLLHQYRLDLAHSAAVLLDKHNLIRYERRSGAFQTTALGRCASYYYVTHATMASFNAFLKPTLSDLELLRVFSLASEFKNIVVRAEEKDELRRLLERVPLPVKEGMEEPSAKVNVLLQAYISRLALEGLAISADMVYVQQSAARLTRCMFEIALRRGWAALARGALELSISIQQRLWSSACALRQFTPLPGAGGGLPEETLKRLEKSSLPWAAYYDLSPADLGTLVRNPKLGKPLHRFVHSIPRLDIASRLLPLSRTSVRLDLTLTPDFIFDAALHGGVEEFWILVEDCDGEALVHVENFLLKARYGAEETVLSLVLPLSDPPPPHYFVRALSNRWLHSETLHCVSFRALHAPAPAPPPRALLDLSPLPVASLAPTDPALAAFFAPRFAHFNPIQTQTFAALARGDANVLCAAPSGSGKTVLAELALLRLFAASPSARAVYLTPYPAAARCRYEDWEATFGQGLGKSVVELTGELTADLALLKRAHICIATPGAWDALSRAWKKRRAVADVALFVCDELHLLGEEGVGPVYEVCVTRMRRYATESALLAARGGAGAGSSKGAAAARLTPPARLIGLSACVANSGELADWLGVGAGENFAFAPSARPVPLELRIAAYDVYDASARLLAMGRGVYKACSEAAQRSAAAGGSSSSSSSAAAAAAPPTQSLVFVPSRRQAALTAIDLLAAAENEGVAGVFLPRGQLPPCSTRDEALAHCLKGGVGYMFEGQAPSDRALVTALYASGALGVCVVPAALTYALDARAWGAACCVIMGTEAWDGRRHAHVDYSAPALGHMVGRACKVGGGSPTARVHVLCAGARKEALKRTFYEPAPVESALPSALHDHLNAEVVNEVVLSMQDALDYLTWTFLYRRCQSNPNFYGLPNVTPAVLTDYLSELVESTVSDLAASQCISYDEAGGGGVAPLNLGMIASYYYTAYSTLEVFASSLTAKTKLRGALEVLCQASEFSALLPCRGGEERALRALSLHVPVPLPPTPSAAAATGGSGAVSFSDPHTKANLLLQAHLTRRALGSAELESDLSAVLTRALPLLCAMVDVISSEGWLKPALAVMELCQSCVQGMWADKDPLLLQLPHASAAQLEALEAACAARGVEAPSSVFELAALEPGLREGGLGLSPPQLADVARFCNRYPSIDLSYVAMAEGSGSSSSSSADPQPLRAACGASVSIKVSLAREAGAEGMGEGAGLGSVLAARFPSPKMEGWWVVLGVPAANSIAAIRRVALAAAASVSLDFAAPATPGVTKYKLYLMSDSCVGWGVCVCVCVCVCCAALRTFPLTLLPFFPFFFLFSQVRWLRPGV